MNQESRESFRDEAVEGASKILQGNDEFDGTDNEFEEGHAEENAFDASCAEERGEGTLSEGKEPGQAYDGEGKLA